MSDSSRRGSNTGIGLAVIFVGALLLLATLDVFESGFWENLAALWPLILVAAGMYLILRRGSPALAGLAFGLILFAGVGAAAGLAAAGVDLGGSVFSIRHFGPTESGSGQTAYETRQLPEFRRVRVEGPDRVTITVGGEQSVVVTGDDNLLDAIRTEVSGDQLRIWRDRSIRTRQPTSIVIAVRAVEAVEVVASGDVELSGVAGDDLFLGISASGRIVAEGNVDHLEVQVTASGDVFAAGLEARSAEVTITASGSVRINVRDSLEAHITASGSVLYVGDPEINQTVVGSGSVRRIGR